MKKQIIIDEYDFDLMLENIEVAIDYLTDISCLLSMIENNQDASIEQLRSMIKIANSVNENWTNTLRRTVSKLNNVKKAS